MTMQSTKLDLRKIREEHVGLSGVVRQIP